MLLGGYTSHTDVPVRTPDSYALSKVSQYVSIRGNNSDDTNDSKES